MVKHRTEANEIVRIRRFSEVALQCLIRDGRAQGPCPAFLTQDGQHVRRYIDHRNPPASLEQFERNVSRSTAAVERGGPHARVLKARGDPLEIVDQHFLEKWIEYRALVAVVLVRETSEEIHVCLDNFGG